MNTSPWQASHSKRSFLLVPSEDLDDRNDFLRTKIWLQTMLLWSDFQRFAFHSMPLPAHWKQGHRGISVDTLVLKDRLGSVIVLFRRDKRYRLSTAARPAVALCSPPEM